MHKLDFTIGWDPSQVNAVGTQKSNLQIKRLLCQSKHNEQGQEIKLPIKKGVFRGREKRNIFRPGEI